MLSGLLNDNGIFAKLVSAANKCEIFHTLILRLILPENIKQLNFHDLYMKTHYFIYLQNLVPINILKKME